MVAQGTGGSIVNVSSIASKLAVQTGLAAYAPSKAALDSLTQVMALELGQHKVGLHCARNWDSTRWVCIVHASTMYKFVHTEPRFQAFFHLTWLGA